MIAPLFRQGDPVRKVGGTYEADGFVVGVAVTSRGDVRYVFEFVEPAGMLHIFNEGQLQAREGRPCAPAPEASAGQDTDGYWRDRYMRISGEFDAMKESLQLSNFALCFAIEQAGGSVTMEREDFERLHGKSVLGKKVDDRFTFEVGSSVFAAGGVAH